GFMRSLAGFGKRRPSRVVRSQIESRLVGFIIEPGLHVAGVAQFGERLAEVIFEFRLGGWPIDSLGLFHRDAFDGLALNEETLDRIDWRELIVARLHRRDLIGNAKETPDEILNMRRRVNDEIRLLFGVERRGVRARGDETV